MAARLASTAAIALVIVPYWAHFLPTEQR